MKLCKSELKLLRSVLFDRCSSMYEYHLCKAIIDARLSLFDVNLKFGDKYFSNIDFAKIDLDVMIESMIQQYNVDLLMLYDKYMECLLE